MYINAHTPLSLIHAGAPEISMQRGTESRQLKLEPYQIVTATVAEGGLEKVVLNLKHHRFEANTQVPLNTGQNLSLLVFGTHPRIHFKIIKKTEINYIFQLLRSLDQTTKLLPLIERINSYRLDGFENFSKEMQSLLSGLSLLLQKNPGKLTGSDLNRLWDKINLNLEALLAAGKTVEAKTNLKAMLLIMAKEIRKQGEDAEHIEKMLNHLKLFQLCRSKLAQDDILFLPLPFDFLEKGYLLAEKKDYPDPDNDDTGQCWRISLYLNMSSLGNLEILLLFENLSLWMRILCDSEDKAEIISESLTRLQDHLSDVSLHSFSVGTGAQDPIRSLVQHLAPDEHHFLKTKV